MGGLFVYKKEYNIAINYLNKALSLNIYFDETYSNLAVAYKNKGDFINAINIIKKGLAFSRNLNYVIIH